MKTRKLKTELKADVLSALPHNFFSEMLFPFLSYKDLVNLSHTTEKLHQKTLPSLHRRANQHITNYLKPARRRINIIAKKFNQHSKCCINYCDSDCVAPLPILLICMLTLNSVIFVLSAVAVKALSGKKTTEGNHEVPLNFIPTEPAEPIPFTDPLHFIPTESVEPIPFTDPLRPYIVMGSSGIIALVCLLWLGVRAGQGIVKAVLESRFENTFYKALVSDDINFVNKNILQPLWSFIYTANPGVEVKELVSLAKTLSENMTPFLSTDRISISEASRCLSELSIALQTLFILWESKNISEPEYRMIFSAEQNTVESVSEDTKSVLYY